MGVLGSRGGDDYVRRPASLAAEWDSFFADVPTHDGFGRSGGSGPASATTTPSTTAGGSLPSALPQARPVPSVQDQGARMNNQVGASFYPFQK